MSDDAEMFISITFKDASKSDYYIVKRSVLEQIVKDFNSYLETGAFLPGSYEARTRGGPSVLLSIRFSDVRMIG
ncbi:MAG: hypothetical protein LCH85_08315 [Chloroflexi bacterium]|nr:hypothetical protein [Chloroflexota bacterium]